MVNILFIINPIAGGGKAKALIPLIENTMNKNNRQFKIQITKRPKQATEISQENLDKYDVLVAVGGDGTVNEVAKGMINKGRGILGIIPGGTGNDMARSLGIPMKAEEALEDILKENKKDIDIGKVNSYNFLNISSVGFDAEVVINNEKIKKKIKSRISYAISVVYTLLNFKSKTINIEIDGKESRENILLLAVGNGKYYGGGMKILPMAKVDDQYLDICVISNISKLLLLYLFPTIFRGNHIRYKKYVKIYRAKTVKIIAEEEFFLNIDGEVIKTKKANFSLEEKKLTVINRD